MLPNSHVRTNVIHKLDYIRYVFSLEETSNIVVFVFSSMCNFAREEAIVQSFADFTFCTIQGVTE